jgi:hypothetical protein
MLAKASFADSAHRAIPIFVNGDPTYLVTRLAISRASFFVIVLGAFLAISRPPVIFAASKARFYLFYNVVGPFKAAFCH